MLSLDCGGVERRIVRLARHFAQNSGNSYFWVAPERLLRSLVDRQLSLSPNLEFQSMGPDPGGEHLERLPNTHYSAFLAWRRLVRQALEKVTKSAPADVLHFVQPISYFMVPASARRRAVMEGARSTEGWHIERMLREASRQGALVNCSSRLAQHALAKGLAPRSVRRLRVGPGAMTTVNESVAIKKERRVVFLGHLEARKNPFLFVEALSYVRRTRQDFRVSMLAGGPMYEAVKSRCSDLGLGGLIDWVRAEDRDRVLSSSLVAVTLSGTDNSVSQALVDAMAYRAAVVGSDVGATHRLITPDTGLLVPLEAHSVATAIGTLLGDESRAARMGDAAHALAMRHHGVRPYAEHIERLYTDAFNHGPTSG